MLTTWVVIYTLNNGNVYGWFCRTRTVGEAEQEFWNSLIMTDDRTIKCICELQSNVIDAFFSLHGGQTNG